MWQLNHHFIAVHEHSKRQGIYKVIALRAASHFINMLRDTTEDNKNACLPTVVTNLTRPNTILISCNTKTNKNMKMAVRRLFQHGPKKSRQFELFCQSLDYKHHFADCLSNIQFSVKKDLGTTRSCKEGVRDTNLSIRKNNEFHKVRALGDTLIDSTRICTQQIIIKCQCFKTAPTIFKTSQLIICVIFSLAVFELAVFTIRYSIRHAFYYRVVFNSSLSYYETCHQNSSCRERDFRYNLYSMKVYSTLLVIFRHLIRPSSCTIYSCTSTYFLSATIYVHYTTLLQYHKCASLLRTLVTNHSFNLIFLASCSSQSASVRGSLTTINIDCTYALCVFLSSQPAI